MIHLSRLRSRGSFRHRRLTRVGRAAGVLLPALLGCSGASSDETVQAVVSVRTAIVSTQPFTETIGAIGGVTGRAGHVASVSAPALARVVRVLVSVGQHVG